MKHMLRRDQGFALPTILIASVIMLIVLMSAVTAVSSITGGINSQYYNQLAREAAESGLSKAETCLRLSNFTPTWTDAAPLKPDTDCNGVPQGTYSKWVISTSNTRTAFTVGLPQVGSASALHIISMGTVELLRTSDPNSPWRTYSVTMGKNSRYNDLPQIAGGAGYGSGGHNGYMLAGSGVLYGWGDNTSNQLGDASLGTSVLTPIKIVYPSGVTTAKRVFNSGVGASLLCILATHNTLGDQAYCRGAGNLIGGSTWRRFALPGSLTAVDVSLQGYGNNSMCVLASDQQVYCAGMNDAGNLGNAAASAVDIDMSAPTKFRLDLANPGPVSGSAASLTVKKVITQDLFTCVIASDDQAYCAGENDRGQLGQGTFTTNIWVGKSTPGRAIIPGNPLVDSVITSYHYVGTDDGLFYHTIGSGSYMSGHNFVGTAVDGFFVQSPPGQCPVSPNVNCYPTPRQITPNDHPGHLSIGEEAGPKHSVCLIALTAPVGNSGLWCVGSNGHGQLGSKDCVARSTWYGAADLQGQTAAPLLNREATYQMNSTMVITTAGDVFAAGDNTYGKLGTGAALTACNGTFAKVQLPVGVKGTAIANGDEYTAFILGDNGKVYAMGRNNSGQLGDGTTTNRNVPVEVKIPRQETVF